MFRTENFEINNLSTFPKKCIQWLKQFDTFCMLDSHAHILKTHKFDYREYDMVIAAGVHKEVSADTSNSLANIDELFTESLNWQFGFFSYDLKNSIENLNSNNCDYLNWPDYYFFIPKYLLLIKGNQLIIQTLEKNPEDGAAVLNSILETPLNKNLETKQISVNPRMSKEEYIKSVNEIKKHILRGDIYEMNFCQEFFAEAKIDPYSSYKRLNAISPTPFSCFFRLKDNYLISASPERFIKKHDLKIISQPIKGTIKRGDTLDEDEKLKKQLQNDPKERAENLMIVDLVRNDLSRIAARKTVKVEELCGIYSFNQLHQMVSTVSAILTTNSIEKIIKATFPMGSMTGAPKIRAMELAEELETSKRGLYSGAVGYISPNKDFDFNVVIRSLQFNSNTQYLSYMVGGAITALSDAEKEYEECLLKASGIERLLKAKSK